MEYYMPDIDNWKDFLLCFMKEFQGYLTLPFTIGFFIKALLDLINKKEHIIKESLQLVDPLFLFVFWICHCIGLILLPVIYNNVLYKKKFYHFIAYPIMMILNYIGCRLNNKYACIPAFIEVIIAIILLFHSESHKFKPYTLWRVKENILMLLSFVYISASISACSIFYILFARIINDDAPSEPKYAVFYFEATERHQFGLFISTYLLFFFFSQTIGFAMVIKQSFFMIVPLAFLSVALFMSRKYLLFGVLTLEYIINIVWLFYNQRKATMKHYNGPQNVIFNSNLLALILYALPTFCFMALRNDSKFTLKFFSIYSITILSCFILFFIMYSGYAFFRILAPIAVAGYSFLFLLLFCGFEDISKMFEYQLANVLCNVGLGIWRSSYGYNMQFYMFYSLALPFLVLLPFNYYEYDVGHSSFTKNDVGNSSYNLIPCMIFMACQYIVLKITKTGLTTTFTGYMYCLAATPLYTGLGIFSYPGILKEYCEYDGKIKCRCC